MSAQVDITEFYKGELLEANFLAKNRDNTPLTSPGSATVSMTISETLSGSPLVAFTTSTGQISLTDIPTASYLIRLSPTDLILLTENKTYYYNIWTWQTSTEKTLQADGRFILKNSIEPS